MHGIKEIGRVPTSGGVKTAVHAFQNNIYLITAEHDANSANDTFEGSTLYKLVEHHGKLALEKIQVLNVIEPNDVQFWDHQDEVSYFLSEYLRLTRLLFKFLFFQCSRQTLQYTEFFWFLVLFGNRIEYG